MRRGVIGEVYNVSSPEEKSNLEVLSSILWVMGKAPKLKEDLDNVNNSKSNDNNQMNGKMNQKNNSKSNDNISDSPPPSNSSPSSSSPSNSSPSHSSPSSAARPGSAPTILDPESNPVDVRDSRYFSYISDRFFNDRQYLIQSKKLERLGWKPEVSWEEGIRV
jgi:dTDP-D-glucose 4,6-dehydratase